MGDRVVLARTTDLQRRKYRRVAPRAVHWGAVLLAAALACVSACKDSGTEPNHDGHVGGGTCGHIDQSSGLVLASHNLTLLRLYQFSFDPQYPDHVTTSVGGLIHHVSVNFLDSNGQPIEIAEDCTINNLAWEVIDPTIAEVRQSTESRWAVDITGKRAGTTQVRFRLTHDSHSHFTSDPIPIVVTQP
jgi:hypothetical protein